MTQFKTKTFHFLEVQNEKCIKVISNLWMISRVTSNIMHKSLVDHWIKIKGMRIWGLTSWYLLTNLDY